MDGMIPTAGDASAKRSPGTRRRGRPTAGEVAAISRQILDAARDMFQGRPFADVTIDAIAERAGVERNTVYKRFPDKRSVLQAVLVREVVGWAGNVDLTVPAGALSERLKAHATRLLQRSASPDVRTWTHLAEVAWPGLDGLEHRREVFGYGRMVEILCEEIAGSAQKARPNVADAKFIATALMSILTGWADTVGQGSNTPDDEIAAFAGAAVDLIMHGFTAR